MAAETVTVERHGPVLRVRMNRPDKLNAQHPTTPPPRQDLMAAMTSTNGQDHERLSACVCRTRRVSRTVTQLYDAAAGSGIV